MAKDVDEVLLNLADRYWSLSDGIPIAKRELYEAIVAELPEAYAGNDFAVAPSFRNHECPDVGDLKIYTYGYNAAVTQAQRAIAKALGVWE